MRLTPDIHKSSIRICTFQHFLCFVLYDDVVSLVLFSLLVWLCFLFLLYCVFRVIHDVPERKGLKQKVLKQMF